MSISFTVSLLQLAIIASKIELFETPTCLLCLIQFANVHSQVEKSVRPSDPTYFLESCTQLSFNFFSTSDSNGLELTKWQLLRLVDDHMTIVTTAEYPSDSCPKGFESHNVYFTHSSPLILGIYVNALDSPTLLSLCVSNKVHEN